MSESTSIALLPHIQPNNPLLIHTHEDLARLSETQTDIDLENDEAADNGRFLLSFTIPSNTLCEVHGSYYYIVRVGAFWYILLRYIT